MYSFQDLEAIERNSQNAKRAVIVGGGLIGIEFAEMMLSRGIEVTFLVRESYFWGNVLPEQDSRLISNHIKEHHVDLKFNTELAEILDDGTGKVKGVITNTGEEIDCQIVGLTAGVSPNVDFIKSSDIEVDRGVKGRRPIEQVWYTGRIMGETLAQTICGNRLKYQPGPWFNSAKFFDIEYQTYGWVFANQSDHENRFYWEHEDGHKAIHIVWDKNTDEFIGLNAFGIRFRHEIFDQWLKNKASIHVVMEHLRIANFDPELFKHYEQDIVEKFNQQTGKNIKLVSHKWWQNILKS